MSTWPLTHYMYASRVAVDGGGVSGGGSVLTY